MKLFEELKRRNVFRVAGVYAVVAWLLIQVVVAVKAPLSLPSWTDTLVIVLFAIGFPIALILAWAFEMTPEGMKLTATVAEGESIAPKTGRKLDYAILAGLSLVVILILGQRFFPASNTQPRKAASGAQSVAVLPFIDLSPNKNEGYFSDGVSEEILNVLARIPKLKVAGRTSSFQFKGKDEDLRLIGNALGVNHVLEGSVRRDGDVVRITAQLVTTNDGFHVWSETYDRKLTDIFEVQDEIARAVADQLALSLGLSKEKLVPDRTSDTEAYQKYLEAKSLVEKRGQDNINRAILLLDEVTARDPHYAPAWAALANIYSIIESYNKDAPEQTYLQWRAISAAAARRAIALNPNEASAYLALSSAQINNEEWVPAFDAIAQALQRGADKPDVLDAAAQSYLQMGYLNKAKELSEKAIALDPLVGIYHNTLGQILAQQGDIDGGMAEFKKSKQLSPQLPFPYTNLIYRYVRFGGHFDKAMPLAQNLVARGFWPRSFVDNLEKARAAWDDKTALAKLDSDWAKTGRVDVPEIVVAYRLGDEKRIMDMFELSWNAPHLIDPNYTNVPSMVMADPRWKAKIKSVGLYDLWKKRGFPSYCKPVGDDDFECK
ncbi:MAG: tetratricopeptide repeat protein [Parvularculaceae bacterium]